MKIFKVCSALVSLSGAVIFFAANSATAGGFGDVRRYEGELEADRGVGMGEVRLAEERMEQDIRDQAKNSLIEMMKNFQSLRLMPNNPENLSRLEEQNLSAEKIKRLVVVLESGQSYVYDFDTQFQGIVGQRSFKYGIHD